MNALPALVFAGCLASTAHANLPSEQLAPRRERVQDLQRRFTYAPAPNPDSASALPKTADEPDVRMEPFMVIAKPEVRALHAALQDQEQTFRARTPSLQNGAVIFLGQGRVFAAEVRLKLGPIPHGLELFRVSLSW